MKREDRAFALFIVLGVAACFGVLYGGASVLSAYTPWRVRLDLPFESAIPFVPWMAVVYLSMDLLVGVAPFVLPEPRRLAAFAGLLVIELLVGATFFVLLPVENVFPPRVVEGGAAPVFWLADTLNLERNYFPSLHVAFSFTAARSYPRHFGWWCWAFAIAASTMLIHEHYLLDVLGGIALALLVHATCFERLVKFDLAEALRTEWLVFTDFVRFALRHRRYALIDAVLYALAFPNFRERRVLRTGFALLQVVDDVLDGDRPATDPLKLAARVAEELSEGSFSTDHLGRLTAAFHRDAPAAAVPVAIELIHTMMRDRARVEARARWSEDALREQLRRTFIGSLDVLLICGGSTLRAADVPALVEVMGWCSAVRDLEKDLGKGLCNVPDGVPLDAAHLDRWLDAESARARPLIVRALAEIAALPDPRAVRWLGLLARSTRKYLRTPNDLALDRSAARLDA